MDQIFFGMPDNGSSTTWPRNSPNHQRLIFHECCVLSYEEVPSTCCDVVEVTVKARYDGLGVQYVKPVLYADNNGTPGEKLTIHENVIDLTRNTPGPDLIYSDISILKYRILEPGFYWIGIYAYMFRPRFDFAIAALNPRPYYIMDAVGGNIPEFGTSVTIHPVGEIEISMIMRLNDSPWSFEFENTVNSNISIIDSGKRKKNGMRRVEEMQSLTSSIHKRAFYRKKLLIEKTMEDTLQRNKGCKRTVLNTKLLFSSTVKKYRFIKRLINTCKIIHDSVFSRLIVIKIEKILFSPLTLIRLVRENILNTVYKNQTALRFIVDTAVELGSGDVCEIRYCKPDGVTGSFPASILNENSSLIYHDITSETELDVSGWWKFWAYITFTDGRSACGKAVKIFIADEGS